MSRKITIGRGEYNDIRVPEHYDTVSNQHADIEVMDDGMLCIIDHSSNGTIVNGVRIHNSRRYISYGDRISLSKSFDLSWTLIDSYLPKPHSERVSSKATTRLQHARETEMLNQDRNFHDDFSQPVSYNSNRNKEIESSKRSWSWGGFLLGWIWGLGHSYWWPSLVVLGLFMVSLFSIIIFLPLGIIIVGMLCIFNFAMSIFLGIKGNSIAWENGCFESIEHFRKKEHGWTIAGIIVFILFFVIPIIFSIATLLFGIAFFI